jgi:hypothetical protein
MLLVLVFSLSSQIHHQINWQTFNQTRCSEHFVLTPILSHPGTEELLERQWFWLQADLNDQQQPAVQRGKHREWV